MIKARSISINANLLYNIWLEIVIITIYILNHILVLRIGIILFKALYGFKLILSHIKLFGYRIYPLIYNILKL